MAPTSLVRNPKKNGPKVTILHEDLAAIAPFLSPPSQAAVEIFDIEHSYFDNDVNRSQWRLQPGEHGLSRILRTRLSNYNWQTELFKYPDLLGAGVSARLQSYLLELPRAVGTYLSRPPVKALLTQQALYLDAWSRKYSDVAVLEEYKSLGLVNTLPGMQFNPKMDSRRDLMKVYTTACILDRFIAAAIFYSSRDIVCKKIALECKEYETDVSRLEPSHPIYSASETFSPGTVARACVDTLHFRASIDDLKHAQMNSHVPPTFAGYSEMAMKCLGSASLHDHRADQHNAIANIFRAAWGLISHMGLTRVCFLLILC